MPIYRIADLNIKIEPIFENTQKQLMPYLVKTDKADFEASAAAEEIEGKFKADNGQFGRWTYESSIILSNICKKVLSGYQGFFFHSSCLMLDGEGVYIYCKKRSRKINPYIALAEAFWRQSYYDKR